MDKTGCSSSVDYSDYDHSLPMVEVTSVSISCSLFVWTISAFVTPHIYIIDSLYILESRSLFSSFVYLSCFWISLSFYHYCGHRLCETFASFSYFCLPFWNLCSLYLTILPELLTSTCPFHSLFSRLFTVFFLYFPLTFWNLSCLTSSIPPAFNYH